ncbi:MAG: N-acetyltransferase [Candidatus Schmidhempelia sp.]|nr:N-acetyltransferase [Candidatus Schmidhempelia sp.]
MLTYQNAKLSDLSFIVEVYNSTIASRMVTADLNPIKVEDRLEWFNQHNPTSRPLWIIYLSDQPCGWVSLSSFYGRAAFNKTAEISIYLHPMFRGQQLGEQVIHHVEKQCPLFGIETILSFIFHHNYPSIKLFTRLGYQQWGYFPEIAELDSIKRDLVIYGKKLLNNKAKQTVLLQK